MKNLLPTTMLLIACLLFISCNDDNDDGMGGTTADPIAEFSFTTNGKTVDFVNSSTDATSYEWNFGDGNSSTDASPSHNYEGNGSYIVELTAINDSGSDSRESVVEIINVTIDGDFTDWDDVEAFAGTGSVTTVKVENLDNNKLFLYVEGTEELSDLTQILLDLDNDRTTGAFIEWLYFEAGEDVILEGNLPSGEEQYGAVYGCEPCDGSNPGNWNWGATPITEDVLSFIEASPLTSIPGGAAYELSIDLTALGQTISSDGVGIAVMDVSLDTWGPIGSAPAFYEENDNPEGTLYRYTFK